jgi:hypothetical protein
VRPKFHELEVVRASEHGIEGTVQGYIRRAESDDAWELLVWAIDPDDPDVHLWVLREDELVSTGFLAASEDGGERTPLDPGVLPPERGDELGLRLSTELTSASDVVRASAEIADVLALLRGSPDAVVGFERRHEEPLTFDLDVKIQAGVGGFEALGALLALRPDGWTAFDDDGWQFEASWSRDAASPGSSLLTTAAAHADVVLLPWSHTRASAARARQALGWPPAT